MINYEDLDYEDIFRVAGEYSNYIMEFDCSEGNHPVCIYEFYENEYQELLKELESLLKHIKSFDSIEEAIQDY